MNTISLIINDPIDRELTIIVNHTQLAQAYATQATLFTGKRKSTRAKRAKYHADRAIARFDRLLTMVEDTQSPATPAAPPAA